jgi:uncharacterized membrane protein
VQSPSFQRGTDNGGGESGGYYAPGAGWQHGEEGDTEPGRRGEMDVFETRLGLRMDVEACLSYLVLPPVGGVLLLILEHKSDYVRYVSDSFRPNHLGPWQESEDEANNPSRFHAWQSSLLFTFMFIIHVIFSWSSVLSWILFVGDLGLIGWLTFRAYKDGESFSYYYFNGD